MTREGFPDREDLMLFARDVAGFEPAPGDSPEFCKGVLTALTRRARRLVVADQVDALSSLAAVPPPDEAA